MSEPQGAAQEGPRAAIVGIAGPALLPEERRCLQALPPAGVILFRRNCRDRAQVQDLVAELQGLVPGWRPPILIDQEGGRVMRLQPPHWRALPPAGAIGHVAQLDPSAGDEAAWLLGRLIAHDLRELGIAIACAPVLDVAAAGMTEAIGSRAFAADPLLVARLGRAFADGLRAGGVAPVLKHLPGHGRATVDSHLALPVVSAPLDLLRRTDFLPFRALAGLPLAMTAHVVYPALDPERPATISPGVIATAIRGEIGFTGLLLSDDLAMGALSGDSASRTRAALAAGCDLALHCRGRIEETEAVLAAAGPLPAETARRWQAAAMLAAEAAAFDPDAAERRLVTILDGAMLGGLVA